MKRLLLNSFLILAMAFSLSAAAFAQEGGSPVDRNADRALPESVSALKLDTPVELSDVPTAVVDASLLNAEGPVKVIVRLTADSVAEANGKGKALSLANKEAQAQQNAFVGRVYVLDPNAREIASVQQVLNAVFLEIDASVLPQLAKDPAVKRINRVRNYEMDLSETVPYIGATAVQGMGYDGSGVRVAVLDSGIDYTHAALGGSGDPADFDTNDPTIIEAGSFPTAKVIGGYDFVGSDWSGGASSPPEAPDSDPLDDGSGGGHGTHVGHIIGGAGGVAPGASLYAVKVCSSVSTACSGIALIQGMEFAVDPDGNGNPSDAVDVINMSLGSDYGQAFDDDLSAAVDNATTLGVLTVAAAGNGGDKPYIVGTPSTAASALSVAQTSVPRRSRS